MASLKALVNEGMEALFQAGLLDEASAAAIRGTPGGARTGFGLQPSVPKAGSFAARIKAWRTKGSAVPAAGATSPTGPRKVAAAGDRPSRQKYT